MGLLSDTITKSLYTLVGFTRLYGLEGESPYASRTFIGLSLILGLLTFYIIRLPVTKAIPAYLFLVMQVMIICKEYDDVERIRDAPVVVLLLTVSAMSLYAISRHIEGRYKTSTSSTDEKTNEYVAGGMQNQDGDED